MLYLDEQCKARSLDRALILWGLCITASTVLACADGNAVGAWVAALLLPLSPSSHTVAKRAVLVTVGLAALVFGPHVLLIGVPLALAMSGLGQPSIASLGLLISTVLLYPKLQSLPITGEQSIQWASLAFLAAAAWVPLLIFLRSISCKSLLILGLSPIVIIIFLLIAAEYWITPKLFTSQLFRYVLAILPACWASWFSPIYRSKLPSVKRVGIAWMLGATLVALLPHSPVREVVFDEAHGKWETTQAPFGPADFGRSANYTYSQLYIKARLLTGASSVFSDESEPLPGLDSLLVIKTPANKLSPQFSRKVADWVANGGRLLVVADHTDLYDTTQNVNELLFQHFGIKINADATYDFSGMPTIPTTGFAAFLVGRIDAHGREVPWQTGASLQKTPLTSVEIATFGPSFSEEGDYSRPNRFGQFIPALRNRYFNHSAAIATSHGLGAVAVVLDSTPWSNFAIFKEQYNQLFRGVVWVLEHPYQLFLFGIGSVILSILSVVTATITFRFYEYLLGFFLGITVAAGIYIGFVAWFDHKENRDFIVRVVAGSQVRFEFLKQILIPGEQNYSRIVSALGKYNLMPLATSPGTEIPQLKNAKKWLLIAPDPEQLPKYSDTLKHLHNGGDLILLFAPEQSTNKDIRAWLYRWGLITRRSIGLSIFDGLKDINGSFLGGRGAVIGREIRVVTTPVRTSLLSNYQADQFIQTYTLRPTKFPRESGMLSVGFSAEQFSDDAIGEVWEGTIPSSLGKLRERQLASIIRNVERPSLMPDDLVLPQHKQVDLPAFVVLENGQTRLSGKFNDTSSEDEITTYFLNLRDQAGGFVSQSCPSVGEVTTCDRRLLTKEMVEWMVTWHSDDGGNIQAIELLHERRMSGLNSTWNVIFGN